MIQCLFILNSIGEIIIEKHYRGLVSRTVCDSFWHHLSKASSPQEVLPIIVTSKYYLIHVQGDGLFYLAAVTQEVPPLLVIEFLYRVVEIFNDYFESISEEVIKDNFTTVYQLLDELVDNGMPFNTEPNILKEMIAPPNLYTSIVTSVTGSSSVSSELPNGSLSSIPWRKTGVKHTTDEIFFDIIEEIDTIIDKNGQVLTCEVSGTVQCKCFLSGMPDLTLIFTNPRLLTDVSFHPCVRYNRWEHDKVISFVPPDGGFKLMTYRVTQGIQLPIYVKPQISFHQGGGSVNIMVGPKFTLGKPVEDLVITVPFSKSVSTTTLKPNHGTIEFDEIEKICVWKIGKLPKEKSPLLSGSVSLTHPANIPDSCPTILVDFLLNAYTASGIKVESLTLHNEKYRNYYKGVKMQTKAGTFQVRS